MYLDAHICTLCTIKWITCLPPSDKVILNEEYIKTSVKCTFKKYVHNHYDGNKLKIL